MFTPSGFPVNISTPSVFPMSLLINVEEAFRESWRMSKYDESWRRITANEMTLAQQQELEEKVMRETRSEKQSWPQNEFWCLWIKIVEVRTLTHLVVHDIMRRIVEVRTLTHLVVNNIMCRPVGIKWSHWLYSAMFNLS